MTVDLWRNRLNARVATERSETARLLRLLGEIEQRGLAVEDGYPSLYAYLTETLGFSEAGAVVRLKAARACREFPALRRAFQRGWIALETLSLIGPYLCRDNWKTLARMAAGRPTSEVRRLVASFDPREASPQRVRFTGPEFGPACDAGAPEPPLPRRVEIEFGADEAFLERVDRARSLLRSKYPSGAFEDLFLEAVEALVEKAERRSPARARAPRRAQIGVERPKASRYVPQRVRAEVWRRDNGRCAYRGPDGIRCTETTRLEFDHIVPWALGGTSDNESNIRLLCRVHNLHRVK